MFPAPIHVLAKNLENKKKTIMWWKNESAPNVAYIQPPKCGSGNVQNGESAFRVSVREAVTEQFGN